jgi:hypothetical protein
MNTSTKTAVIVGILFIVATASSSLGFFVRDPILEASDYLVRVSAHKAQVLAGVILVLVDCIAVVGIAVMLFPILKPHSRAGALAYVGFRTIEAVVIMAGEISVLALVTLSQEFVRAGAPDTSYLQTLGTLLLAVYRQGTHLIGIQIVFSLTALILNLLLYRTRLVPRWISAWGLIGAALLLAAGLIGLLGPGSLATLLNFLSLPIAVQEMVFAVWLIVKGGRLAAWTVNP